jgi:uncharacterized membrane protein YkvA (DUF1232 family)
VLDAETPSNGKVTTYNVFSLIHQNMGQRRTAVDWKAASRRIKAELAYYRRLGKDPRTPWLSKILIAAAIAYLLSPVDIIPDFIPILGHLDDIILVPGLIWAALAIIPESVKHDAREAGSKEPSR